MGRGANGVIGSEDVVGLDEKDDQQSPGIEEEWADLDCDTTVLDDDDEEKEEEEEEEGEWYDSDDTAFDEHEEDDTFKLDPQPETLKIEPEGVWISDEVITVGAPW